LLVKVAKTLIKAKVGSKLTFNTQIYRSNNLWFDCEYQQCSSFRTNRRPVSMDDWQGLQWAPFLPNELEEYVGTDQNDARFMIQFVSSDSHAKCLAFRYYAATFSRILVSLQADSLPALTLYPTIKLDNQDRHNRALDWYDNELCLADILPPESLQSMANDHSSRNHTFQLIFTSAQPQTGGYVAIASIKLLDDSQRPAAVLDRQMLTGWSVDGAVAAEQWTSAPADSRWIQPELSSNNRLSILIRKPQLLGSSGLSLLSTWFTRSQGQTLRFQLQSNFSQARIEVQLLNVSYSIVWSSNARRLWPGELHWWSFDIDHLCPSFQNGTSQWNCSKIGEHLRWRIQLTFTNQQDPVAKSEELEITSLDQSDACAVPDTCLHESNCQSVGLNRRKCNCATGYHGARCEYRDQCVLPLPGQRSGIEQCVQLQAFGCIPIGSDFRCECAPARKSHNDTITASAELRVWSESRHECVTAADCSRVRCPDALQRCVQRAGRPQCECLPGYQATTIAGQVRCLPLNPCLKHRCPSGARCVDTSGGVMTSDVHKIRFCHCDVRDGMHSVRSANADGFTCEPLIKNPFVKQAYKCYMDYEVRPTSNNSDLTNKDTIDDSIAISTLQRSKRWILDGHDELSFDFNREDSTGSFSNSMQMDPKNKSELGELSDKLDKVRCRCAEGYRLLDDICVPQDGFQSSDCRPACGSTEHCVLDNSTSLATKGQSQCECQIGFSGTNCARSYCESAIDDSSLNQLCGRLGCQVGISALQLNWFSCNCHAATKDQFVLNQFDKTESPYESTSGYRTNSISGLCVQRDLCSSGSVERADCDRVGGVCVPRQHLRDGPLFADCVCGLGFGWHLGQGRCVSLCDLDTHCGPLNARCQLVPTRNSTQCTCPVGRRWDPLRAACVLGDRRNRLYQVSVEFQLINDNGAKTLYEQATSSVDNVDCLNSLDPEGCAKQVRSARRRLVTALHRSMTLKQLLDAQLIEHWIDSLRSVFAGDVLHVTPIDVKWAQPFERFTINRQSDSIRLAYEDEDDVIVNPIDTIDNQSNLNESEPIPPIVSFYYQTLTARLMIDTAGQIDWDDLNLLHRACIPLINDTNQFDSEPDEDDLSFCALPPRILLRPNSLEVTQVELCDVASELNLCPINTYVQCSADAKRFGCQCNRGYAPILRIPQEVDGPMLIHFCNDIDECQLNSSTVCDASTSQCINLPGSYRCDCLPGFKPSNTTTCVGKQN
jgi:hypothetical protein